MRRFLQKILTKPVISLANRFSSKPDKKRVHQALSELFQCIKEGKTKKGVTLKIKDNDKFVILSDQHKGCRDDADDFSLAEKNYLNALDFYYENNYFYINLGDSEELWENSITEVKKSNVATFAKEKKFAEANRFVKIFGNHDLYWDNDPFAAMQLQSIYQQKIKIYEGAVLQTQVNNKTIQIFLTHGHQGDKQSDGNWFSKWFVANVWAPFQAYLKLNPNTPAYDVVLKTEHNRFMYEWSSAEKNVLLITGHTHQPVFMSLTHLERLYVKLSSAQKANDTAAIKNIEDEIKKAQPKNETTPDFSKIIPSYFNSGCCCFNDGDITGIEIANECIRLIKWKNTREVLEEIRLSELEDLLP